MLAKIERLLPKLIVSLLQTVLALLVILVAGGIAYDHARREWDVSTFALLVGGGGYFVAQIATRRTAAVEIGFIASALAAGYASLARPGTGDLLLMVGYGAILGVIAIFFRKLGPAIAGEPEPAAVAAPPVPTPEACVMLRETEQRLPRTGVRMLWLVAVVGGAEGAVAARFTTRNG